jgi:hypothetical protein
VEFLVAELPQEQVEVAAAFRFRVQPTTLNQPLVQAVVGRAPVSRAVAVKLALEAAVVVAPSVVEPTLDRSVLTMVEMEAMGRGCVVADLPVRSTDIAITSDW